MKNLFWLGAAMLLMTACSSDDPTPAAVEEAAVAPVADVVETPATAAPEEDAVLEVLEESASEQEPEEQAIMLAQADTVAPPQNWQFKENQHYFRLVPTQPTVGGADKIEVAEFFWYGCPHCYTFEPYINAWAENKPANVRFVRVPATWNATLQTHAQLYYTEEVLVTNGKIKDPVAFRDAVFTQVRLGNGRGLGSKDLIQAFFARFDVSADDFQRTWSSFEVSQKMRVAMDLERRYGITSVPMIVVNGKYRTSGAEAGSLQGLIDVINELVAREDAH
jgi:thiol:disulfide interchange protein DsbA